MGGGGAGRNYTEYKLFNIPIFTFTTKSNFEFLRDGAYLGEYITQNPNAAEKVKTLAKGLDDTSLKTLCQILARAKKCFNNEILEDTLSEEESRELKRIKNEFKNTIVTLKQDDKEVYFYNGYILPIHYFIPSVWWHKHNLECFSLKTLEKMRQKDIIDAGGFIGDSALILQNFTQKMVRTFEPSKTNFALMLQTLNLNESSRIIPVNKGLGAKPEKLQININQWISASSFVKPNTNNFEEAEITTLDAYVKEHNVEVGFIKVYIQGFEMEFLKGAKETICQQKPAMLISIYYQTSDFFEIKPLIESWNLGYSFKIIKPIGFQALSTTALFCEVLE